MFRHPPYLEIPWDVHWHHEATRHHGRLWWLVVALVLVAMFSVAVGVTSGLM